MQSVFAAVRVVHGGLGLAYALQVVAALGIAASLIVMARAKLSARAQNAALAAGAVIATPFVLDYDLTWVALPPAWLFVEARRPGFLPWGRRIMCAAFRLPLFSLSPALYLSPPYRPRRCSQP